MAKPLPLVNPTGDEKTVLKEIIKKRSSPQGLVKRARIILLADKMKSTSEIMKTVSVCKTAVVKWRRSFIHQRLDGLKDTQRSGRKPLYDGGKISKLISKVLEPPKHITHWSTRELSKELGMSHMTVQRILNKNDIKPHNLFIPE